MAAQVPDALKAADITRFAHRAAQLEKPKPIMAYWCQYWIVNQILSKGLHNSDQESLVYTTGLMDRLEEYKSQHASEPAVTDDVAGKAYVEQFALDTFDRADKAVRANKASRQTADTFQASATFLDLLQIWGPLEAETAAKAKFAKYHALRIAKALRAGEDPNLSNPAPATPSEDGLPALDPDDADVQALGGDARKSRQPSVVEVPDEADKIQRRLAASSVLDESIHPSRDPSVPPAPVRKGRQPSVVEVPDEADRIQRGLARQSALDESLHPSRAASPPRSAMNDVSPITGQDAAAFYTDPSAPADISPLDPPAGRKPSVGGHYFPRVPSPPADLSSAPSFNASTPADVPSAPSFGAAAPADPPFPMLDPTVSPGRSSLAGLNNRPTRQSPPLPPHRHGQLLPQTPPGQPPLASSNIPSHAPPPPLSHVPPQAPLVRQPHGPVPPPPPAPQAAVASPTNPTYQSPQSAAPTSSVVDEEAIMKAQKHARWAISALNFEDVPTAIRELRGALASLGAT